MASLTSGQSYTRNLMTSNNKLILLMERIALIVLKRFRFPEIAEVTSVNAEKMEVKCKMLYRVDINGNLRETKWLKVYSPFASKGEGFVAPPRIGDIGIVIFRNGDTNSGIFWGLEYGNKSTIPETDEKPQYGDWFVKNKGSWIRIKPNSDIHLRHNDNLGIGDKNEVYIGNSFVNIKVPEVDLEGLAEEQIPSTNKTPWRISEGTVEFGLQRRTTKYDTNFNRVYKGSWIRKEVKNGFWRIDDGWILEVLAPQNHKCSEDELKEHEKPSCGRFDKRMHRVIRKIYVCHPSIEVPRFAGAVGQIELCKEHYYWDIPFTEDPWKFTPHADVNKTSWENFFKKINFNLEIPCMTVYTQKINDFESHIIEKTIFKSNVCEVITYANGMTADHLVVPRKIQENEIENEYKEIENEVFNPKEGDLLDWT